MEELGKLTTIDELDLNQNRIGEEEMIKFFSEFDPTYRDRSRPKGLDYLVMDNFVEIFGLDSSDLLNAKIEA